MATAKKKGGTKKAPAKKAPAKKRGTKGSRDLMMAICRSLPGNTEDIKWGNDLIFSVGSKMYCGTGVRESKGGGFKTDPLVFEALIQRPGIIPAPYAARFHWVSVEDLSVLDAGELESLVRTAHRLVASKLSKKKQVELFGAPLT